MATNPISKRGRNSLVFHFLGKCGAYMTVRYSIFGKYLTEIENLRYITPDIRLNFVRTIKRFF